MVGWYGVAFGSGSGEVSSSGVMRLWMSWARTRLCWDQVFGKGQVNARRSAKYHSHSLDAHTRDTSNEDESVRQRLFVSWRWTWA